MKHTICYVSKASKDISDEDIHDVFEITQHNNLKNSITGVLLHGFGNFFQVLEGEKDQIQKLFKTICEDDRHYHIETLINHHVPNPIFRTYSSKFNVIKTNDELENIKTYLDVFSQKNPYSDKINRLINPFIIHS